MCRGNLYEFVSKSTRCLIKVGAEIAKKIPHRHCAWTNMSSGAAGCCDSFDSFDVWGENWKLFAIHPLSLLLLFLHITSVASIVIITTVSLLFLFQQMKWQLMSNHLVILSLVKRNPARQLTLLKTNSLPNWATKKKRPYFPLNPGSLIGILIMVYEIIPI